MISQYLENKSLVEKVLTADEILNMTTIDRDVRIMMGQTFDEGQPIDMLKYGLFIMNLSDLLSKSGARVISNWLIADHFITEINEDMVREEAERQSTLRFEYLSRLNQVYGGSIGFVLSSELCKSPEYQSNLKLLKEKAQNDPVFRQMVFEAIPADRRDNPKAINYPLEELAVIESLHTDIKVGPKYEIKYDRPAREFASMTGFKKFSAIHLRNCYPFGNPEVPGEKRKEIEEFGVLPYKKNSKGLGSYRIDPVNDSEKKIVELIRSTTDIRPLQGLIEIYKLILMRQGREFPCKFSNNLEELRNLTIDSYQSLVGKYFNK